MSNKPIPWKIEEPGEFPYEATRFPFRIVNDLGESIALVGDELAKLMVSAPELKAERDDLTAKNRELVKALTEAMPTHSLLKSNAEGK